jgi:hypothetical protein
MVVGGGVFLLVGTFIFQIRRIETLRLKLRPKDLVQGWRIPWYIQSGVYEMVAILAKDLLACRNAHSLFRVPSFKARSCARGFLVAGRNRHGSLGRRVGIGSYLLIDSLSLTLRRFR